MTKRSLRKFSISFHRHTILSARSRIGNAVVLTDSEIRQGKTLIAFAFFLPVPESGKRLNVQIARIKSLGNFPARESIVA